MRNQSGQIIPFLLVIMAIFLGAYLTTVNIGKAAIRTTCSSNAADACSLGVASEWDKNLNQGLVELNHLAYQLYTEMRDEVQAGLDIVGGKGLMLRGLLPTAHDDSVLAKDSVQEAIDGLASTGSRCTTWSYLNSVKTKIDEAKNKIKSVRANIVLFNAAAIAMEQRIQEAKEAADNLFQELTRNLMDGSGNPNPNGNYDPLVHLPNMGGGILDPYLTGRDNPPIPGGFKTNNWTNDSRNVGAMRGFQNSCWFNGLSSETQKGILKTFADPKSGAVKVTGAPNDPYGGSSYESNSYNWKTTDSSGRKYEHGYKVDVELPKIAPYELETLKKNHPEPMLINSPLLGSTGLLIIGDYYGKDTSSSLTSIFETIETSLNDAATEAGDIKGDTSYLANSWQNCPKGVCITPSNWIKLAERQTNLKSALEAIKLQIKMADTVINNNLIPQLTEIKKSIEERGDSSFSPEYDPSFSKLSDKNDGQMVLGIKKVNYEGGETENSCKVTQTTTTFNPDGTPVLNPDGTIAKTSTTSSSTVNFNDGERGNIWRGSYCPKITKSSSGK